MNVLFENLQDLIKGIWDACTHIIFVLAGIFTIITRQEVKQFFKQAKGTLCRVFKKYKVWIVLGLLFCVLVITLGIIFKNLHSRNDLRNKTAEEFDNEAQLALETFNSGDQIQGLIGSIFVGEDLYKKYQLEEIDNFPVDNYLTTKPLLYLQTMLENIRELDRFDKYKEKEEVTSTIFHRDGEVILTATNRGTVRLWKISGEEISSKTEHKDAIRDMSFSRDGRWIATASDDGTVGLWKLSFKSGNWDLSLDRILDPGKFGVVSTIEPIKSVDFSPDLQIKQSQDLTMMPADLPTSKPSQKRLFFNFNSANKEGTAIFLTSSGDIKRYDLDRDLVSKVLEGEILLLEPDPRKLNKNTAFDLAVGDRMERVAFLEENNKPRVVKLSGGSLCPDDIIQKLNEEEGTDILLEKVFYLPGHKIATTASNGKVYQWEDTKCKKLSPLDLDHAEGVQNLEVSRVTKKIITISGDGDAYFWETPTSPEPLGEAINDVDFSYDGDKFALAIGSGDIVLQESSSLQKLDTSQAHRGGSKFVKFTSDGTQLVSAGNDNNVAIWDISRDSLSKEPVKKFHYSEDLNSEVLESLDLTPDGKLIVTLTTSNKDDRHEPIIRLWDFKGRKISEFKGMAISFPMEAKSFETDKLFVTVSANEDVMLRRVEGLDESLQRACKQIGNYLDRHQDIEVCEK